MRRSRRTLAACLLTIAIAAAAPVAPAFAEKPKWIQRIQEIVGDEPVSVVIGLDGRMLYRHRHRVTRPPASNQKLLLSMALLHRMPIWTRIPTRVLSTSRPRDGILRGNLWIVGRGDPETGRDDTAALARALKEDGIRKVRGRVMGATGPFARDWWARGWRDYFPTYYIALPTALTFRGNLGPSGRHIRDPERRAAASLTSQLRKIGVVVKGRPGMGSKPSGLTGMATVMSEPLRAILHRMNVRSSNFRAEVLGKYLGASRRGPPGSIAKGAAAIRSFVNARGVNVAAFDASGLSYANRITAGGIVRLLWYAAERPWGETLRGTLAQGGQGTLKDRLTNVKLRAKTGTLEDVSALSGWVWLQREDAWAEFSILSRGISKTRSVRIENAIVRVVSANAGP